MDRLTEMEAFATVVNQGGFTDAARKMGISKSAVSKHVSSLEARLGTRLLNRTTRRLSPTEIGLLYYDRALRVLNDAGEADALVTSMNSAPCGLLRISVATDFGKQYISPILGEFLEKYPEIHVNMELENRYAELISEGYDAAVRVGEFEDHSLHARKIAQSNLRMIASPAYLEEYGTPVRLEGLNDHRLLHYSTQPNSAVWKVTAPSGERRQIRTSGWLSINDGQSLLQAAIGGLGLAYLPSYIYGTALRDGRVVDAMPNLPQETQYIHCVYSPNKISQPKVRAFVDFLAGEFAAHPDLARLL